MVVGRLEHGKARTAHGHAPGNIPGGCASRQLRQCRQPRRKQQHAHAAQAAGWNLANLPPHNGCNDGQRHRPGADQHAHLPGRYAIGIHQQERHGQKGHGLRTEGADGSAHGQPERRNAQQIQRQHGLRPALLALYIHIARQQTQQQPGNGRKQTLLWAVVTQTIQPQEQRCKHGDVEQHIPPGQPPQIRRLEWLGQGLAPQPAHPQRQRHVQAEQPAPVQLRQHRRRQHRPGHIADGHHHGVQRQALPQLGTRINLPHQRAIDAQRPCHAHTLQSTRHNQPLQRRCQRRQHTGQAKHQHAPQVHTLVAQTIAQRSQWQQQHQRCHLVGIDHPQRLGRVNLPLPGHLRQGQTQHSAVEHTDHQAANNDCHGQLACTPMHAIWLSSRCHSESMSHIKSIASSADTAMVSTTFLSESIANRALAALFFVITEVKRMHANRSCTAKAPAVHTVKS